jgi:hypothetical protein
MARAMEGERGQPDLHSEHSRDVESLAGRARQAVSVLYARLATTLAVVV